MLVENFTVTENIVLGHEPKKGLRLDMDKARDSVREVSDKFGLEVDPDALIENISVGLSQRVEILKALHKGAEILILDEPTAVLTPQEIDDLGDILHNLTKEGKSIILITHKLKEVLGMSDRVTILRRGKVVGTVKTADTNAEELAEMMVGREVQLSSAKTEKQTGDVILAADLVVRDHRDLQALKGVSFQVHAGEVLAIAAWTATGKRSRRRRSPALQRLRAEGESVARTSPAQSPERIGSRHGHIPRPSEKRFGAAEQLARIHPRLPL